MKVVISSATEKEIELLKDSLSNINSRANTTLNIEFHISGVGIAASTFSLAALIFEQKPDLIIQAGIAGSFDLNRALGSVVAVEKEYYGDTGVEENGVFKDLFDLNLQQNQHPYFENGLVNLKIDQLNLSGLEQVTAVTINEITTRTQRIEQLRNKYNPAIESMEGASLHYTCIKTNTPFLQIRSISNYIGERDKSKWAFKEALKNLSDVVTEYIEELNNQPERQ